MEHKTIINKAIGMLLCIIMLFSLSADAISLGDINCKTVPSSSTDVPIPNEDELTVVESGSAKDINSHIQYIFYNDGTLKIYSDDEKYGKMEGKIAAAFPWEDLGGDVKRVVFDDSITFICKWVLLWYKNPSIESVYVPDSVDEIPQQFCTSLTKLTTIRLPETLLTIGSTAFQSCSSLVLDHIPSSVTTLGSCAFRSCGKITSIDIPSGVSVLPISVFAFTGITEIELSNNIVSIEASAFNGSKLKKITFGNSVKKIGEWAFNGTKLSEDGIYFTGSLTDYLDIEIAENDWGTFDNYLHLSDDYSVSGFCGNQHNVGYYSYGDGTLYIVGHGEMKDYPYNNDIYHHDKLSSPFTLAGYTSIVISEGITSIGDFAFAEKKSADSTIQNVTLPSTLTEISQYAFYNCATLLPPVLPENLEKIGNYAFYGCANLADLVIDDDITVGLCATEYIGSEATIYDKSKSAMDTAVDYLENAYSSGDHPNLGYESDFVLTSELTILHALAEDLTSKCTTDEEKCMAIANWIKNNITYGDTYSSQLPLDVIRRGTAICSGYANLFTTLVRLVGVKSAVLRGYKYNINGNSLNVFYSTYGSYGHQWSLAYYDGAWHNFDVLWTNLIPFGETSREVMASCYFVSQVDGVALNDDYAYDKVCGIHRIGIISMIYENGTWTTTRKIAGGSGYYSKQCGGGIEYSTSVNYDGNSTIGTVNSDLTYYDSAHDRVEKTHINGTDVQYSTVNYEGKNVLIGAGGMQNTLVTDAMLYRCSKDKKLILYKGECLSVWDMFDPSYFTAGYTVYETSNNSVLALDGDKITVVGIGDADITIKNGYRTHSLSFTVFGGKQTDALGVLTKYCAHEHTCLIVGDEGENGVHCIERCVACGEAVHEYDINGNFLLRKTDDAYLVTALADADDIQIACVAYDADGRMTDLKMASYNMKKSETVTVIAEEENSKLFVLNSNFLPMNVESR